MWCGTQSYVHVYEDYSDFQKNLSDLKNPVQNSDMSDQIGDMFTCPTKSDMFTTPTDSFILCALLHNKL